MNSPCAIYELYNTTTEQVEGMLEMTEEQARDANTMYRTLREPHRWVKSSEGEDLA